ncbi:Hypothetical Protein FCC1311_057482 [Hondaea fermentalgiana]|uniref:AP2/ERF domain-containing protein n=1 Tax=Hondaea fermentalgiana TaxID=2315210 RepID=A0A2R5GF38_9STRA|nr:Hypothetical Protein FCC1311_057482 [Hondaea fermentalgiana]|eukprot:GBG29527.1 Hypothetical Protein FCC1311_057482 [Hondaea fermentalgiana]
MSATPAAVGLRKESYLELRARIRGPRYEDAREGAGQEENASQERTTRKLLDANVWVRHEVSSVNPGTRTLRVAALASREMPIDNVGIGTMNVHRREAALRSVPQTLLANRRVLLEDLDRGQRLVQDDHGWQSWTTQTAFAACEAPLPPTAELTPARMSKDSKTISPEDKLLRRSVSIGNTGFRGVTAKNVKFQARIRINGDLRYLGTFDTAEDAAKAYDAAARMFHARPIVNFEKVAVDGNDHDGY